MSLFWSVGSISSLLRYSCLSILSDENTDIFAVSLCMCYQSFSSLICSWVFIDTIYICDEIGFFVIYHH